MHHPGMYWSLSPETIGHGSVALNRRIELARKNGFLGVDPPMAEVRDDPQRARRMVEGAGLRWGSMPLRLDFRSDDVTAQRGLAEVAADAAAAEQIGCDRSATWLSPFHDRLDYEENFDAHLRRLRPACQIMADYDVRVGLEFVGPKTLRAGHRYEFVHTMGQALSLADAIGTGNVGLLLDCFHWFTAGVALEDICRLDQRGLVLVHVNDGIAGRSAEEQLDHERALPGTTGVIDLDRFLGALKSIDYDGPLSIEPFMPSLAKLSPDQAVAQVAASLQRYPL